MECIGVYYVSMFFLFVTPSQTKLNNKWLRNGKGKESKERVAFVGWSKKRAKQKEGCWLSSKTNLLRSGHHYPQQQQ
jgi:hypothetical protein